MFKELSLNHPFKDRELENVLVFDLQSIQRFDSNLV
jgi:hypothetical protein